MRVAKRASQLTQTAKNGERMSATVDTTPAEQKKRVYALCRRADRLRAQGHYGQAETLFKKALALAEAVFAPDVPEDALALVSVLNNHAVLYNSTLSIFAL
jgi:hypothetical protein